MSLTISPSGSVIRQFDTPRGSRVMRPGFGSRLHLLVDRRGGNSMRQDSVRFAHEAIRFDPRITGKKVTADGTGNISVRYTTATGSGTVGA